MDNDKLYYKIVKAENIEEQKSLVTDATEDVLLRVIIENNDKVFFIRKMAAERILDKSNLRKIISEHMVGINIKIIALKKLSLSKESNESDYIVFSRMFIGEQLDMLERISDETVFYKIICTRGINDSVKREAARRIENVKLLKQIAKDYYQEHSVRKLCIDKIKGESFFKTLFETERDEIIRRHIVCKIKDLDYLIDVVKQNPDWLLMTTIVKHIIKLYPKKGTRMLKELNNGTVKMCMVDYPKYNI